MYTGYIVGFASVWPFETGQTKPLEGQYQPQTSNKPLITICRWFTLTLYVVKQPQKVFLSCFIEVSKERYDD